MTYDEFIELQKQQPEARPRRNEEHRLQVSCVTWFRMIYPEHAGLLYAVPNGGRRDAVTGRHLKAEGVLAGVSDLNLDLPNRYYHGMRIEMKIRTGRQQQSQRRYQQDVERAGYKYAICRSLDAFMEVVKEYMKGR